MENETPNITPENTTNTEKSNKKKKIIIIILIAVVLIIAAILAFYFFVIKDDDKKPEKPETNKEVEVINANSPYEITSNDLEDFDLYFLQLENKKVNKIYSPLSIKYALEMLAEGANGKTKEQITNILGKYESKKYINSNNMSFANALFIKNSYKNSIKASYTNTLKNTYNAEILYDNFENTDALNAWINKKTFGLINNLFNDISDFDFILVNSLAIDMEWINKIQNQYEDYLVKFPHEKKLHHYENETYESSYTFYIEALNSSRYHKLDFENLNCQVKSVEIGAVANKYDIVNILGKNNIKQTVANAYEKYISENPDYPYDVYGESTSDFDSWFELYLKRLDSNYGHISSSTDFQFYTDENTKVFAKDLKEYNGTTLQYIGIMPTNMDLENYIAELDADKVNNLINSLKTIELNSFKDNVITEITGYIPMFQFEYELDIVNDLKKLGITSVFDNTADLSNITKDDTYIADAKHKTNIEFSNDGIKAASALGTGGTGEAISGFDYLFDVPIEQIDLTFNKPYLFIIRDKDTGEVWFTGTVYEPSKYTEQQY